jgi:hypothetical protein
MFGGLLSVIGRRTWRRLRMSVAALPGAERVEFHGKRQIPPVLTVSD